MIGQLAQAVFAGFPPAFYLVTVATGVILVLAANTAFNGFPVLASILARDGLLPRQLHTRGDRLAFSNGIIALAGVAIVLIISFDAEVTRLIQLYVVGVFISFTMSQTGMVRHWTRLLATETDARERARMVRARRSSTAPASSMTGSVLVVVLITKFTHGAWITLLAMAVLFVLMRAIRKHYDRVATELAVEDAPGARVLPSRVHAIVLVSKVHRPTLRALAYARVSRPSALEALTVDVDPEDTARCSGEWDALELPVPLKALDSPYREVTRPIVQYVRDLRRESPRDLRRRLHPGVRGRPLVGAAAAQPVGAAPEGTAAVHAGGRGGQRAVPAQQLRGRRGPLARSRRRVRPAGCRRPQPRPAAPARTRRGGQP